MNGGICRFCLRRGDPSFIPHSSFLVRRSSRGFTLVELLVVVGMIALIMGALTTAVSSSMQRARIQKATADVKMLTQAILAYENYKNGELPTIDRWKEANFTDALKFLNEADKDKYPVLIQAALSSGGVMRDPWGQPYRVKITPGDIPAPSFGNLKTGYYLPNFYRLTRGERGE